MPRYAILICCKQVVSSPSIIFPILLALFCFFACVFVIFPVLHNYFCLYLPNGKDCEPFSGLPVRHWKNYHWPHRQRKITFIFSSCTWYLFTDMPCYIYFSCNCISSAVLSICMLLPTVFFCKRTVDSWFL